METEADTVGIDLLAKVMMIYVSTSVDGTIAFVLMSIQFAPP
jgi:hypothetical protein